MDRICCRCKQDKPISEYYKDRRKKDGHRFECKKCSKEYDSTEIRRIKNKESSRKWRQTEEGKAASIRGNKIHKKRYPEHARARQMIRNNINRGKIPHASELRCIKCDNQAQEYHHHLGYSPEQSLNVVALCRMCHKQ